MQAKPAGASQIPSREAVRLHLSTTGAVAVHGCIAHRHAHSPNNQATHVERAVTHRCCQAQKMCAPNTHLAGSPSGAASLVWADPINLRPDKRSQRSLGQPSSKHLGQVQTLPTEPPACSGMRETRLRCAELSCMCPCRHSGTQQRVNRSASTTRCVPAWPHPALRPRGGGRHAGEEHTCVAAWGCLMSQLLPCLRTHTDPGVRRTAPWYVAHMLTTCAIETPWQWQPRQP